MYLSGAVYKKHTSLQKYKRLGLKDCVTYNSELNPRQCAHFEEGLIIDCEEPSLFLFVIVLHLLQDLF